MMSTESIKVVVKLRAALAARDLTYSLVCKLAESSRAVVTDLDYQKVWIQTIYNGFISLIKRTISNQTTDGKVPIAVFQIFAALRNREIRFGDGHSISLKLVLGTNAESVTLPPIDTALEQDGRAEIFNCYAEIIGKGPCANLGDIGKVDKITLPHNLGDICVGQSLGPLGVMTSTANNTPNIRQPRGKCCSGEEWMRYMGWAESFDEVFMDQETMNILFPGDKNFGSSATVTSLAAAVVTPGLVVLTRALGNFSVLTSKTFDFPVVDVALIATMMYGDAGARGIKPTYGATRIVEDTSAFFEYMALLSVAHIGVKSGQTCFIQPLQTQSQAIAPQAISEGACMNAAFRDGNASLPVVVSWFNMPGQLHYDSNDGKAMNAALAAGSISVQYPTMFVGYQSIFNNPLYLYTSFLGWPTGMSSALVDGDSFGLGVWGTDVVLGTHLAKLVTVLQPNSFFQGTISYGPLGNFGDDAKTGRVNMTDASRHVLAVYTAGAGTVPNRYDINLRAVSYRGKGLKSASEIKMFSLFALALEGMPGAPPLATADWFTNKTYKTRTVMSINSVEIVSNYVAQAVTEPSAKNTTFQNLLENLDNQGLGGDSIWAAFAGTDWGKFGRGALKLASGLGIPGASLVNSVVEMHYSDKGSVVAPGKKKRKKANNNVKKSQNAAVKPNPKGNKGKGKENGKKKNKK